jgi:hypothetical protein
MGKFGCGRASKADAVRSRKWHDREVERLEEREIKRAKKEALQKLKESEK